MASGKRRDKQETLAAAALSGRLHQVLAAADITPGEGFFRASPHLARTMHHEFSPANQLDERILILQRPWIQVRLGGDLTCAPGEGAHGKTTGKQILNDMPANKAGYASDCHGACHCAKPASCCIDGQMEVVSQRFLASARAGFPEEVRGMLWGGNSSISTAMPNSL